MEHFICSRRRKENQVFGIECSRKAVAPLSEVFIYLLRLCERMRDPRDRTPAPVRMHAREEVVMLIF